MEIAVEGLDAPLQARLAEVGNVRAISSSNSDEPTATVIELPRPAAANVEVHGGDPAPAEAGPEASAPELPANFADLTHLLEQGSRKALAAARNLELRRQHLAYLLAEQDLACAQLDQVLPAVQDTHRALKAAIDARQTGASGPSVEQSAALNARALDELEELVSALSARANWYRAAWDDYMQAAESAHSLRVTPVADAGF